MTAVGSPWPVLVATGPFTPPRLIKWPIAAGLSALIVYVLALAVFAPSQSPSGEAEWLANYGGAIQTLNADQVKLQADESRPNAELALGDWRQFDQDAVNAASLPNPGGRATAPWREMLNDFIVGSQAIIQGIDTHNEALIKQGEVDLTAGGAAVSEFNRAMGLGGQ